VIQNCNTRLMIKSMTWRSVEIMCQCFRHCKYFACSYACLHVRKLEHEATTHARVNRTTAIKRERNPHRHAPNSTCGFIGAHICVLARNRLHVERAALCNGA